MTIRQISTTLIVVVLLTSLNLLIFHSNPLEYTTHAENLGNTLRGETEEHFHGENNIPSLEVNYNSGNKEIWEDLLSLEKEIGTLVKNHKAINDRDATVIGFMLPASLNRIKQFVGSLRRTGYGGNIILGVKENDITNTDIKKYLDLHNVNVKIVQFADKCKYPYPNEDSWELNACPVQYPMLKIRWGRFALAYDWLMECITCTGPVFLADTYDVIFQGNPFGADAPEVRELQLFEEHSSRRTTNWIVDYYVKECKDIQFDKPMLCSGSIIGPRDGMLFYLSTMTKEMFEWMKNDKCRHSAPGDDMAVHNYLFYTNKLPMAKVIPHRTGTVSVIGSDASEFRRKYLEKLHAEGVDESEFPSIPYDGANENTWISPKYVYTDKDGYFINIGGTRSRVVHQFDRFGQPAEDFYHKRYAN